MLTNSKFLTLDQYTKLSLKIIQQWNYGPRDKVCISDDLIGLMIRYMAKADQTYDSTKSSLSREKFRRQAGIYAIRYSLKKKENFISNVDFSNLEVVSTNEAKPVLYNNLKFIIDNAGLSPLQQKYVDMYLDGKKPRHISRETGDNVKSVCYQLKSAIKKMKTIARRKHD